MRGKQKLGITCSLATVLSLGLTMNASATIITDQLYNTGLNATGDALPANGGVDANWSVSPGSNAVTYKHRLYAANSTTSMWISSNSSGGNETTSSAEYLFSTSFDLSGYDPVSAQITGLWGVDNYATIFLNNNATGVSGTVNSLVDNSGTSTGANVTWTTFNTWDLQNGDSNGTDQDMMSGYLDNFNVGGPQTLTISGIQPNKGYDIYVYFNREQETYTGITASDGTNTNTYYARDNGSNYATNGYMISSDDNIGDGWTDANVFQFTGYTGSTLDFSAPGDPGAPGAWKVYVQGIQLVVTVPEPSSTALLGLGGVALMLRRRRK